MKNTFKRLILSLSFLISLILGIHSQEITIENPELFKENIALVSDRTIYISGEKIYFRLFYSPSDYINKYNFSKVVYIELIKIDGSPIVQEKFPLDNTGCSGVIYIPETTLTGKYYIKAYTKWMRNYNVKDYSFNQIQIYNPGNSSLCQLNNVKKEGIINASFSKDTLQNNITLKTEKKFYKRREKVSVTIDDSKSFPSNFSPSISVVRKGIKQDKIIMHFSDYRDSLSIKYYPEIYGLSLSGRIKATDNNQKAMYEVNIGSLNGLAYFSSFNTKEDGVYCFNIPNDIGTHELFLSVNSEDQVVNMEIDNAFCERPLYLEDNTDITPKANQILVNEIAINDQINNIFSTAESVILESNRYDINFYGTGNKMLYPKDFIDLPYLEDFLFELVPEVIVHRHKGVPKLYFAQKKTLSNYPVLLMVDNIFIYDLEAFLKIPPQKIKELELVDHGYVVGDNKYSGIISVVSNNRDMAGIDLPKNAMFLNYKLFSSDICINNNIPGNQPTIAKIPDRRNCLYWNPNVSLNSDSDNRISFNTSDVPGDYQVILQYYDTETKSISTSISEFTVK